MDKFTGLEERLFKYIEHGDTAHKAWLRTALQEFFDAERKADVGAWYKDTDSSSGGDTQSEYERYCNSRIQRLGELDTTGGIS